MEIRGRSHQHKMYWSVDYKNYSVDNRTAWNILLCFVLVIMYLVQRTSL